MPIVKLYSDSSFGGNTCDGVVLRSGVSEVFSSIRNNAGTGANAGSSANVACNLRSSTTFNQFFALQRGVFTFDTSVIGNSTINSAKFSVTSATNGITSLGNTTVAVVSASPGSFSTLISGDYNSLGTTLFSSTTYSLTSVLANTEYIYTLNTSGENWIDKDGKTAFGLRLNWDIANVFTGSWSSNVETAFYAHFADSSTPSYRPYLEVDYTPNFILVPVTTSLSSQSSKDTESVRYRTSDASVGTISDTDLTGINDARGSSLIESSSNFLESIIRLRTADLLASSVAGTELNFNSVRKIFTDLDSVTDLVSAFDSTRKITTQVDSATDVDSVGDIYVILRTILDSITSTDLSALTGTTIQTQLDSTTDWFGLIGNQPVDFLLNIASATGGRWSFIEKIIAADPANPTNIDTTSSADFDLIFGLIQAALFWTNHLGDYITNHSDDRIQFDEFGVTAISTEAGSTTDFEGILGWQTLIEMQLDANVGVTFSFARFKRADTEINSVTDAIINSEPLRKLFTEIIATSEAQLHLLRYVFGTTDLSTLSGVEQFVESERYLELNIDVLSDMDLILKSVRKSLMQCDSVTDVVSVLSPIRKMSLTTASDSEIALDIIGNMKATLNCDSVADLIPLLRSDKFIDLGIDSNSDLVAYLREIILPFQYIIARFTRVFNDNIDSLSNSATGLNFSMKQFRRELWTNNSDFGITNHLDIDIDFYREIN